MLKRVSERLVGVGRARPETVRLSEPDAAGDFVLESSRDFNLVLLILTLLALALTALFAWQWTFLWFVAVVAVTCWINFELLPPKRIRVEFTRNGQQLRARTWGLWYRRERRFRWDAFDAVELAYRSNFRGEAGDTFQLILRGPHERLPVTLPVFCEKSEILPVAQALKSQLGLTE